MIALLPLRGWVGDVMAMEMTSQQLIAAKTIASSTQITGAQSQFNDASQAPMPADCPMLAMAADQATGDALLASSSAVCSSCDLCLAMAVTAAIQPPAPSFLPRAAPLIEGARFASADLLPSLKPPIR
ncbi:MAG: hypothetical protein ACRECD_03550 [Burkholderiaceae bacterium]